MPLLRTNRRKAEERKAEREAKEAERASQLPKPPRPPRISAKTKKVIGSPFANVDLQAVMASEDLVGEAIGEALKELNPSWTDAEEVTLASPARLAQEAFLEALECPDVVTIQGQRWKADLHGVALDKDLERGLVLVKLDERSRVRELGRDGRRQKFARYGWWRVQALRIPKRFWNLVTTEKK